MHCPFTNFRKKTCQLYISGSSSRFHHPLPDHELVATAMEKNKNKKSYRTEKIKLRRTNTLFWKVKYKDKYDKLHYPHNQKQQRLSEGKKKKKYQVVQQKIRTKFKLTGHRGRQANAMLINPLDWQHFYDSTMFLD